jgi:hypothetical protein
MPLQPSDDLPKGEKLKSLHFQSMINPADDRDVYDWLVATRRNYASALGSVDRAIMCDMVRYFIRLENEEKEPRTINVDEDKVAGILGALQAIQDQLENGASKTTRGGKKQKQVAFAPNLLNIINRYESFGESENDT